MSFIYKFYIWVLYIDKETRLNVKTFTASILKYTTGKDTTPFWLIITSNDKNSFSSICNANDYTVKKRLVTSQLGTEKSISFFTVSVPLPHSAAEVPQYGRVPPVLLDAALPVPCTRCSWMSSVIDRNFVLYLWFMLYVKDHPKIILLKRSFLRIVRQVFATVAVLQGPLPTKRLFSWGGSANVALLQGPLPLKAVFLGRGVLTYM